MAMLWFYCDESYESKPKMSRTYVVAGFVAEEKTWNKVEKRWRHVNKHRGVSRFHAAELNAFDHEFKGWTSQRSKRYTKALLKVTNRQKKKLHAVGTGLLLEDYEKVITKEGREKFGHPYLVCFKTCLSHIAERLENEGFDPDWKYSVIFDRNEFETEAVRLFYAMKDDPRWKYRHRMGTCAPGSWKEFVLLEVADLIAYESYRYLHGQNFGNKKARKAISKMFEKNGFSGFYYDADLLKDIKDEIETSDCGLNGFIPILRNK